MNVNGTAFQLCQGEHVLLLIFLDLLFLTIVSSIDQIFLPHS